jgi:hypothetical protein
MNWLVPPSLRRASNREIDMLSDICSVVISSLKTSILQPAVDTLLVRLHIISM